MGLLVGYFVAYILGGITFIPLVVFAVVFYSKVEPQSVEERNINDHLTLQKDSLNRGEPAGYRDLKAGELEDNENVGKKTSYEGWVTITREFYRFTQINPDDFKAVSSNAEIDSKTPDPNNAGTGGSGIFNKIMKREKDPYAKNLDSETHDNDDVDVGAAKLRQLRKKNRFFGVIKHGNLFLYTDETQKNIKHAIALKNYFVTIWPRGLTDGQLFTKRSAICLINKDEFKTEEELNGLIELLNGSETITLPKSSYFLYGDTSFIKEDWYFALIKATSSDYNISTTDTTSLTNIFDPSIMAKTLHFNTAHMLDLIETLNSTQHQLNTKWLNALIGRLFLATYKTDSFKAAFASKIEEKLKKIKTPGFLEQLQIKRTDVGHAAPTFTNPKLRNLSPEGDLEILVNMQYRGNAMIEVATKLLLNIGVGFKQREFDIVVKMVVAKLDGELLIKIKPQPSNRIWYTFTKMPEIDIKIEPLFSSRNLSYGIVTSVLQSKLKDAIKMGAVYPFFDDFVFYKTDTEVFRGGIYDKSIRDDDISIKNKKFYDSPIIQRSQSIHSTEINSVDTDLIKSSAASLKTKQSFPQLSMKSTSSLNEENNLVETAGLSALTQHDEQPFDDTESSRTSEQIKESVAKSYSKIKQWYKKAPVTNTSGVDNFTTNTKMKKTVSSKEYVPPEMISNRRRKGSKPELLNEYTPTSTASGVSSDSVPGVIQRSGEAFMNVERKRNGSRSSHTKLNSISSLDALNYSNSNLIPNSPASPRAIVLDERDEIGVMNHAFADLFAREPFNQDMESKNETDIGLAIIADGILETNPALNVTVDNAHMETPKPLNLTSLKRKPPPVTHDETVDLKNQI